MPFLAKRHWVHDPPSGPNSVPHGTASELDVDAVTGLPGSRAFHRIGRPIVEACLEQGTCCSIAIIDIDHFGRMAEAHDEGLVAEVLTCLAKRIAAGCEGTPHLPARLDDKQFGVLLVGIAGAVAMEFCERLRRDVAAIRFSASEMDFSVTVSIGLADVSEPETFENYLNAAEQFLFMAKSHGRNQVVSDVTVAKRWIPAPRSGKGNGA